MLLITWIYQVMHRSQFIAIHGSFPQGFLQNVPKCLSSGHMHSFRSRLMPPWQNDCFIARAYEEYWRQILYWLSDHYHQCVDRNVTHHDLLALNQGLWWLLCKGRITRGLPQTFWNTHCRMKGNKTHFSEWPEWTDTNTMNTLTLV